MQGVFLGMPAMTGLFAAIQDNSRLQAAFDQQYVTERSRSKVLIAQQEGLALALAVALPVPLEHSGFRLGRGARGVFLAISATLP
jgi:hypothetical protein